MKKRKKVLQIQVEYNVKETDLHEEICRSLPPEEYEVTSLFLNGHPEETDLKPCSENAIYFNLPKSSLKGLRLRARWRLWQFCRQQQFDVVITHLFKPMHLMLWLNQFLKIPRCIAVVHAFNNFDRSYRKRYIRRYVDQYWTLVAVSEPLQQHLIELDCGLTDENTRTITNALDIQKTAQGLLSREQARQQLGLNQEDFVFGSIARLVRVKGQKHLIQAFANLKKRLGGAKLIIIGGGNLEDELRQQIKSLGLENDIILAGEMANAYRFIPAFDTFLLPSLSEAMPLVILEAMIAKCPVIATDVGGVASMLNYDKELLVKPRDEEALANKLEKFQRLSQSQREQIGEVLYQRVIAHYDIETYRSKYLKLIGENEG